MTIGRICTRQVDLAETAESVSAAAERMLQRNVGTLVVLGDKSVPIGLVTDRDLALRVVAKGLDSNTTRVLDVMTETPTTASEDTAIEDALRLMRTHAIRRLLVVGSNGQLVGLVSIDDILSLIVEEFREVGELLSAEAPGGTRPM